MASAASACSGGPEHDESTRHHCLFLLSELNTHYLNLTSLTLNTCRISLDLNLLTTMMCFMEGVGISWKAGSQSAPLAASLSESPANPASADSLAHEIFMSTN